jgi:hypothetical protein
MKSPVTDSDRTGRSLLLAAAASFFSMVISISLEESISRFTAENPMIHPVLATIAASVTFWLTYPRVNLAKLWVFMPIAFVVITILFMGVRAIDPP